jgi:cell division septum initiation protein DivIVA
MKRLLSIILLITLVISLAACSSQSSDYAAELEAYEKKVAKLQKRIKELEEQLAATQSPEDSTDDIPQTDATGSSKIALGQTVTIPDVITFSVTSCTWEDQILPSNTSGVYSYKPDQEDETYLVFRGTFTNLNGNSYDVEYIQDSTIQINEKYSFTIYFDGEDPDGTGFSSSTKPLQTVNFVIYSSISDGVKDVFENATITLNILNDPERTNYFFDEDDDCKNTYTMQLTKEMLNHES